MNWLARTGLEVELVTSAILYPLSVYLVLFFNFFVNNVLRVYINRSNKKFPETEKNRWRLA